MSKTLPIGAVRALLATAWLLLAADPRGRPAHETGRLRAMDRRPAPGADRLRVPDQGSRPSLALIPRPADALPARTWRSWAASIDCGPWMKREVLPRVFPANG